MIIVKPTKSRVQFETVQEATLWLFKHTQHPGTVGVREATTYFALQESTSGIPKQEFLDAAILCIQEHFDAVATLRPTWTDAEDGTHYLADLDTRYLTNILKVAEAMPGNSRTGHGGIGLVRAIKRELASRKGA